jgi:hypothetical protein
VAPDAPGAIIGAVGIATRSFSPLLGAILGPVSGRSHVSLPLLTSYPCRCVCPLRQATVLRCFSVKTEKPIDREETMKPQYVVLALAVTVGALAGTAFAAPKVQAEQCHHKTCGLFEGHCHPEQGEMCNWNGPLCVPQEC